MVSWSNRSRTRGGVASSALHLRPFDIDLDGQPLAAIAVPLYLTAERIEEPRFQGLGFRADALVVKHRRAAGTCELVGTEAVVLVHGDAKLLQKLAPPGAGPSPTAFAMSHSPCPTRRTRTARWSSAAREGVEEPHWVDDEYGRVELAAIGTYGDNIHTFVNRSEYTGPYLPGASSRSRTTAAPPEPAWGLSRSTTSSAMSSSAT